MRNITKKLFVFDSLTTTTTKKYFTLFAIYNAKNKKEINSCENTQLNLRKRFILKKNRPR